MAFFDWELYLYLYHYGVHERNWIQYILMVDAKHGITCPGTAADPRCSSSNHRCEYSPWNQKKIIKKNISVAVCSWLILALYFRWIFQLPPTPPAKKKQTYFLKISGFSIGFISCWNTKKNFLAELVPFWSGTSKKKHILNSAPPPLLGLQGFQGFHLSPPKTLQASMPSPSDVHQWVATGQANLGDHPRTCS